MLESESNQYFAATGPSGHGKARGLHKSTGRREYLIAIVQPRNAELAIGEKCWREQPAESAGTGDDRLIIVRLREAWDVRNCMLAVDVAEVEHALHAKHQTAGLEVAADLTAADKAAVFLTAVVRNRGSNCVIRYPRRVELGPA